MSNMAAPVRRMVTILFCDLCDSTGISAALEPEQFAELLEQIRLIAQRVIPAHGGELIRLDGDGMLCVFGYPLALEDAGRRATEAALELHGALAAPAFATLFPDQRLRLHSGIHAGMVLLRPGDIVRGKYEILGDATNTAARLCDAAGPGEILASEQTLGAERHLFVIGAPRAVAVSGRATALACLPVLGRAAVQRRFDARATAGLTPFQGRDAQCTQFAAWLAEPHDGAALFFVHGPAGIGKSRLLQALVQQAQAGGWPVAQGYCESYLSAPLLQPFQQAAAAVQPGTPASVPDAAALAAVLTSRAPMLLIIDDWQWADDASRSLLTGLLNCPGMRVLLASREAAVAREFGDAPVTELGLPPLDAQAARGAIDALLPAPDPFAVAQIERAAGGSPLLIEELCHAFAGGQGAPVADLRGAWFDAAVQARFERLDHADQELLKLSAVIGHMVPIWLIEELMGVALDEGQLSRLQNADFLFPAETGGTYRFKHGLTRDSLYAAIGRDERRALHGEVQAALVDAAATGHVEPLRDALAYHAIAAGDVESGLPHAIAAGDAALAIGALDRAQAHYLAALGTVPSLRDPGARRDATWTLLNKYGLACIIDPAPDQLPVLEAAEALLIQLGSPYDAMRAAYWLGSIAYGVGLSKRSVQHLEKALALAQAAGSPNDELVIKTKLAQSCFDCGDNARAAALHEALLPQLKTAKLRNVAETTAYAQANYGFLQSELGNYALADDYFSAARATLGTDDNASITSLLLYRSAALVSQGMWEAAIAAAEDVLAASQRSRTRMQNRTARAQAAFARWKLTGQLQHAEALERIAMEHALPQHSRQYASMVFGWAVEAMVATGQIDRAGLMMGQTIARVREGGDRLGEAMAWRAMALAAQANDDIARADRRLAAARRSEARRPSRREAAHNDVCQARLLLARGRSAEAGALLAAAAAAFDAMAMPWYRDEALALTNR
jgi:class 3 adenylate cyclase